MKHPAVSLLYTAAALISKRETRERERTPRTTEEYSFKYLSIRAGQPPSPERETHEARPRRTYVVTLFYPNCSLSYPLVSFHIPLSLSLFALSFFTRADQQQLLVLRVRELFSNSRVIFLCCGISA